MERIKEELSKAAPPRRKKLARKAKNKTENENNQSDTPENTAQSENSQEQEQEKSDKKKVRSELNSALLVNQEEITEQQVELDIEEFAQNENGEGPTLPKVLRERKRQREYQEWKEKALAQRKGKVL